MRRNIVLIGMMGAGKTAVGTDLAKRLQVPFIDTDAEIERAATMSITEIFARDGEAFFRARESEVLSRMLSGRPSIISTGGGAFIQPQNRELIRGKGISIWLDCDLETLWHRVKLRPTRPLLLTADPKGTLERLLAERRPVYAEADLTVTAQRPDTVEQTSMRVIEAIRAAFPEVLEKK
ncbi:shikimate kinase [Paracoccus aminophilus]|uniref:Shikimate kinase n=1 Tax=Paracoccus aminophilus JCM 7686 TaxID=1367847 RepID=S5XU12_PARAH|nr:shikimate kinase [Paracoccus aminophilus]AGT08667.1 shikimate kinase [Paracoccus aminophilus JCM 7686]